MSLRGLTTTGRHLGIGKRSRCLPSVVALLLVATTITGCGTSLELKPRAVGEVDPQSLVISGVRGRLHDATARDVLKRALAGSAPADRADMLLRAEQAVARHDLTAGNAVTLLVDGPAAYAVMFDAIDGANEHIHLEIYILGDDELGKRLAAKLLARRRLGVDVRIVLPDRSDSALVLYASQAQFAELMQAGVRLYRRQGAVLHAKTALVDCYWAVIGSANLDYRSFLHNHEAVAVVVSHALAQDMAHLFVRDLEHAEPVNPETWARRGLWQRLMENVASGFNYWL